MTKRCSKCGCKKAAEEFSVFDGRRARVCKKCLAYCKEREKGLTEEYLKHRRELHKEVAARYQKRFRQRMMKDPVLAKRWLQTQRDGATKRRRALRKKVIAALGGKCTRCGYADYRALQIDHVHGGGTKELESTNYTVYLNRVLEEVGSGRYVLLCGNCNFLKREEKQEYRSPNRGKSKYLQNKNTAGVGR